VKVTPTPRLVPVTITSHVACGTRTDSDADSPLQWLPITVRTCTSYRSIPGCGCQLVEEFKTGSIDKLKSKRTLHPPLCILCCNRNPVATMGRPIESSGIICVVCVLLDKD